MATRPRFLTYLVLSVCALFATPFTFAAERPVSYLVAVLDDLQAPAMVRHQLTLAQWRTDSGTGAGLTTGGLRSESNHFVMSTVLPAVVLTS